MRAEGVFKLNALWKVRQARTKAFAEDTELELGTHLRLTHAEESISFLTEQTKIKVRLAVRLPHPRGLVPLLPSTYPP